MKGEGGIAPRDALVEAVSALAEFPGEGAARLLVRAVARGSALLLGDGPAQERCERAVQAFAETIGAHRVLMLERVFDEQAGSHRYLRQVVYQSPAFSETLAPEPLTVDVLGVEQQDAQLMQGRFVYLERSSFRAGHPLRTGEHGRLVFAVPILVEGAVWGAVALLNLEREQRWSAREEAVIAALATLLGTAIERERRTQREIEQQLRFDWLQRRLLDAGSIAHDLNNLLLAIFVALDESISESEDRALLEDALGRARALTGEMLGIAHSAEAEPAAVPIAVDEVVRQATRTVSNPAGVPLDLSGLRPAEIVGSAHAVAQLAANLIQNAVEAIGNRPGRVSVSVHRRTVDEQELAAASWRCNASEAGEHAVLTVQDNGIGMDRAVLQHVFEPYFTTRPTGHGLGMLSALRAAERHRGAIAIATALGHGTRVTAYLAVR